MFSPTNIIFVLIFAAFISYEVYANFYFKSKEFVQIKTSISHYTKNCNDLNNHIDDLKSSYVNIKSKEYGGALISDTSNYNMSRKNWFKNINSQNVHNCLSAVCKNAKDQPFKYLCKYFDIKTSEDTLNDFESVLNNFAAAEQGKILLRNERDVVLNGIGKAIPIIVLVFSKKRLITQLGFKSIDLSDLYFPVYTFQYVSSGGNSSFSTQIKFDLVNLERFIFYVSNLVKFKNSVAGQRALMTAKLREKIKFRDNFSCRVCGLSVAMEKNLLLEIDHIIPLAKGGITSERNLQTLCWKCNRSKGSKIVRY